MSSSKKKALWQTAGFRDRTTEDRRAYRANLKKMDAMEDKLRADPHSHFEFRRHRDAYMQALLRAGNKSATFPAFEAWSPEST